MSKLSKFMLLAVAVVAMAACKETPEVEIGFKAQSYSVTEGETVKVELNVDPADADLSGLKFSSSDETTASVDAAGVVTGKSVGRVNITATLGNKKAECIVTVKAAPRIVLTPTEVDMYVGASHYVAISVVPSTAELKGVTFTSENQGVATVTNAGYVKAIGAGTTKITATMGKSTAECTVRVTAPSVQAATRNAVLIEEFTGQTCRNCPAGAKAIHNAMATMPEGKTILIAHHVGYAEDDFTMAFSRPLTFFYGDEGTYAPGCMMDRRRTAAFVDALTPVTVPHSTTINKDILEEALSQPTYVSLNMTTKLEGDSVTITVTGDLLLANPNARLNVYITQDNIHAYQANGGNDYNHPNMVRAMLSGSTWGDTFENPQGAFTKTYGYKIPASVAGVKGKSFPVVLEDLYVVAFVSEFYGSGTTPNKAKRNVMPVLNAAISKVKN